MGISDFLGQYKYALVHDSLPADAETREITLVMTQCSVQIAKLLVIKKLQKIFLHLTIQAARA